MADIHILCISDIHYEKLSPENKGLVVREFFKDLEIVLGKYDKDDVYCVISGDLVEAANAPQKYEDFHNGFMKKLTNFIHLNHIICTPGNHDFNRNILDTEKWASKQKELLNSTDDEETYNAVLKTKKDSLISKKFEFFEHYCQDKLQIDNYNLFGYSVNITPEVSIYCLNSALLSAGGHKNFPEDTKRLRVETSGLYLWASENEGRTKLLVMHHPLDHLTEDMQQSIENLIDNERIDAIITGHLHKQNFKKYMGKEADTVKYCSTPPLSIGKREQNGYSIMHISGNVIESIEYRKWSTIHDFFTAGTEFSMTPNGFISFKKRLYTQDDIVSIELERLLNNSLWLYGYQAVWVDRMLSNAAPGFDKKGGDVIEWDHIDVVNSKENIQIVGGAQFGLTSFAYKTILEAWKIKHEHWLYFDGRNLRMGKLEHEIDSFCNSRSIQRIDIKAVVIDNWGCVRDNATKVLAIFRNIISADFRFVLMNNEVDSLFFQGFDDEKCQADFKLLYLRELSRKAIRRITHDFIQSDLQGEDDDKIMESLIRELMELNVHRTPVNCLQILLNFKQNYDAHPADRTKMLKSLIQFFFLKPSSYFYTDEVNEQDCCMIMGALCEYLMRNTRDGYYQQYFTENEYYSATCHIDDRYTKDLRKHLFEKMTEAQIIVSYLNVYSFRFSYWTAFFAAYQMYASSDFYDYMTNKQSCIYMPDIIEFYTGLENKCQELVERITLELNTRSKVLADNLGIPYNPFALLKYRSNPEIDRLTREQMENHIKASKLPSDIKDSVLDTDTDNTKPYMQTIATVMSTYDVKNLIDLCRSGSRALRNSELIKPELRTELYNAIQCGWQSVIKVLLVLSWPLTLTGRGRMGGANFALTGEWPDDPKEKHIAVIASIPFNIIKWYRNDVYSARRKSIFEQNLVSSEVNDLSRHLTALLVVVSKPKGWLDIVRKYIESVKKNSFYLADINKTLIYTYRIEYMSPIDLKNTQTLLIECWEKTKRTYENPNRNKYFRQRESPADNKPVMPKRLV